MTVVGYARVSTPDQDPALQLDALKAAGCTRIYTDHGVSGSKTQRAELDKMLAALVSGDVLIVTRLDRLARPLPHLIDLIDRDCE
jgi:DNA invertase Pin-like site-specific DNA recombinase